MGYVVVAIIFVIAGYAFRGKIRALLGLGSKELKAAEDTVVSDVKIGRPERPERS